MQIPSYNLPRLLASYMVHMYSEFVGRRSSRYEWLENFHEVSFAMSRTVVAWICIFITSQILPNLRKKCYYVCSFRQPCVHDIKYNKVWYVLQFSQLERGASMWTSKFLVEVAVKFGVLLDILTNEVRKSPRNHVSCSISKCAFNAKYIY